MRFSMGWSILAVALVAGCGDEQAAPPPAAPPPVAPVAAVVPAKPADAPTPPPPVPVELTPMDVQDRIALAKEILDLGKISEGTSYTGSITILNGLENDVEIRRVAGECSCVKWDFKGFKKIQLLGSLTVTFTLKVVPQYSKKKIPVEVITSSNVTPRLEATITYECVPAPTPAVAVPVSPPAAGQ